MGQAQPRCLALSTQAAVLYHFDTNVLIFGLETGHRLRGQLFGWRESGATFSASVMAWAEFGCGPADASVIRAWEQLIGASLVPVDKAIAELASELFNQTGRRSRSLPDCIIAATAIQKKARLATLNTADFKRFIPMGLVLA